MALEDKANQIINSESVPGADVNSGIVNPIRAFAQVIGEPRLTIPRRPPGTWLPRKALTPSRWPTWTASILRTWSNRKASLSTAVASKVRIDAGVAPLDFRGLQKSNGA